MDSALPSISTRSLIEPKEKLEYLYKEYERLQAVINAYSHSSFDDFKLLGALGLVFAWDPIVSMMKATSGALSPFLLLVGFLVTLAISAIVAIRDLLKQSLMIYHQHQLKEYETQLWELLEQEGKGGFRASETWAEWFQLHHRYVASCFYGLYSIAIVTFSVCVLYVRAQNSFVAIYLVAVVLVSIVQAIAMQAVYRGIWPKHTGS